MNEAAMEKRKTELLDELAKLEHTQWKSWALEILDTEDISRARSSRWMRLINMHWDDLSDDDKYKDRKWAEEILFIIKKYMGIK